MQDGAKSTVSNPLTDSQEGEAFAASVANSVLNTHSRGPSPSPLCWQANTYPVHSTTNANPTSPIEILKIKGVSGLEEVIVDHRWRTNETPTMQTVIGWAIEAELSSEDILFVEKNCPAILTQMNQRPGF